MGEQLLGNEPFQPSNNDYDWLGPGIYFWEANPLRGLEFAAEAARRKGVSLSEPYIIGAILDLGLCLDMTTATGMDQVRAGYEQLRGSTKTADFLLPTNSNDGLQRNLDCAVIRFLHRVREDEGLQAIDTVKGVFTEGASLYPGSGFREKTHIQIAVCNPACIKGVFRVPARQLDA